MAAETENLFLLPEASRRAKTPEKTLRCWIADGRLKATKPGRRVLVTRRDLAACLGVLPEDL